MPITKAINELPEAPTPLNPNIFDAKADALVTVLPGLGNTINQFTTEANQIINNALNMQSEAEQLQETAEELEEQLSLGQLFEATSNTSHTISLGSKTFILNEKYRGFGFGSTLVIASQSDSANIFMTGVVTNYGGTSLTITITKIVGSGVHTDWYISCSSGIENTIKELGFASKNDWENDEEIIVSLNMQASSVHKMKISIYEIVSGEYILKTQNYDILILSTDAISITAPSEGESRNVKIYVTE